MAMITFRPARASPAACAWCVQGAAMPRAASAAATSERIDSGQEVGWPRSPGYVFQMHEFPGALRGPQDGERGSSSWRVSARPGRRWA